MLFQAIKIRELELRNRIMVSPMCQYSSQDGYVNDWHLVHQGSRAVGGAGLIMTEATAVEAAGRITPQDLGIWHDTQIPGLKRLTEFIQFQGAAAGIQLAHAGRKASVYRPWDGNGVIPPGQGGWLPVVAPSEISFSSTFAAPEALSLEGIAHIRDVFIAAAQRALQAGYQVVEIHAAHGYLLHQFLSPVSNQRTDQYGGSFENRTRLVLDIAKDVRALWPETLPVFVRISATDWLGKDGWDIDESVQLSRLLQQAGIDLIDCSSGGILPDVSIPVGPGYQVGFAERIRREANVLTGAVGLITSPAQAEKILQTGQADLVILGRPFLRDPYWPIHAAKEMKEPANWPPQYLRAEE